MFARKVTVQLKPNSVAELTQRLDKEVIPLLRKQKGFLDEMLFVVPGGKEAFGMSLWENAENAEAYNRSAFPEVVKLLSRVIEGTPQIETYDVASSTFHTLVEAAKA
jgi:heme-degrading monooxygenase HmoA